jgi:hypothetical protein
MCRRAVVGTVTGATMQRNAAEWTPVSRRQALAGIGTVAAGAGGYVALGSQPTRAAVTVESFDVADAEFTAEQVDPVVAVDLSYSYDAGVAPVTNLRFELLVAETVVASDTLVTDTTTHDGTLSLRGSVTDAEAWSASDFSPDVAEQISHEVSVTVRFAVREQDGTVIVEDSKADTGTVVVDHPQESTYVASVGGSGSIVTPSG